MKQFVLRIGLASLLFLTALVPALSAAVPLAPVRYDAIRLEGGYFISASSLEQTLVVANRRHITATRIVDGVEIDRPAITVSAENRSFRPMSLASDGRDFLLASECVAGIVCTRTIGADGAVGPERRWTDGYVPEILWTGTDYLVIFHRQGRYRFFRLSRDGKEATSATIGEPSASFAIAPADDGFLVAHWQDGAIVVQRYTSDSRRASIEIAKAPPSRIRIVRGRDGYLIAWMSRRTSDGQADLHFAEVRSDFQPSAPIRIVDGIDDVSGPDIQATESGYLIAFGEKPSTREHAHLRLVEVRNAQVVASRATAIADLSAGAPHFRPLRSGETHLLYTVTSPRTSRRSRAAASILLCALERRELR